MTVGIQRAVMYQILSSMCTGVAPNLINAAFIKSLWTSLIKCQYKPKLQTANKQSFLVMRTVLLHVGVSELCIQAWFAIVDSLAVDLLLGTSFLDHYILESFSEKHTLESRHSPPVAIIELHNASVSSQEVSVGREDSDRNM